MLLDTGVLLVLMAQCAPAIHPTTGQAIVEHESARHVWAVGVNGGRVTPQPKTVQQAAAVAHIWIARGVSVDLGLAQINNRTATRLGLTVEQVLEPCTNLRAMQQVMVENYRFGVSKRGAGQGALQAALSIYNTGDTVRGVSNGYVGGVLSKAGRVK